MSDLRGSGQWGAVASGVFALVAAAVAVAMPAPSLAAPPLKPDLRTLDRGPVRLCQEALTAVQQRDRCKGRGRTVLRVSTFVGNYGAGPMEYVPVGPADDVPADCHADGNPDLDGDGDPDDNDVLVRQRVYEDVNGNGSFRRSIDTAYSAAEVGCRYYHPEHDHYHVEAFSRFLLRNEQTGQILRAGNKISFCVADIDYFSLSLPGAQQPGSGGTGFYSDDTCTQRLSQQGISIGWYDLYGWGLPGQEIDITGIPAGYYCLIVRADPDDRLDESNEANNDRLFRTYINPSVAPVNGYRSLTRAPGGCAPLL